MTEDLLSRGQKKKRTEKGIREAAESGKAGRSDKRKDPS